MTGKHYQWHKRWTVNQETCTATHESGLAFQFTQTGDGAWDGKPLNLDDWQDEQLKLMPLPYLAKHAQRLAKEAGEAYLYQLKQRH
jgi:hypothetical protein